MSDTPNNSQDDILEQFQAFATKIIHDARLKEEKAEDLRRQLKEMEAKEVSLRKEEEKIKLEIQRAKEVDVEISGAVAAWAVERKELCAELARVQTGFNILSATNEKFKERNKQLSEDINQLENEKKKAEQKLLLKEIKRATYQSKVEQMKQEFQKVRADMAPLGPQMRKARQAAGAYIMEAKYTLLELQDKVKQYHSVQRRVEELRQQVEETKQDRGREEMNEIQPVAVQCDTEEEEDDVEALLNQVMKLKFENLKTLQEMCDRKESNLET